MLKVLLVEDDPNDEELIRRALSEIAKIKTANTRAQFESALGEPATFDIILADFSLPDLTGPEIMSLARRLCPDKPLIIVSGTITEEMAIQAVQSGAKDYVIKRVRSDRDPDKTKDSLARLPVAVERAWRDKQFQLQFLASQRMENIAALAAGIAHDLNNIFQPILAGLEIVLPRIPDPERRLLRPAEAAAAKGAAMVKQILRFARGTNGQQAGIRVADLLNQAFEFLRSTIDPRTRIETQIADNLPTIKADPVQLYQVLMNLGINARDAMPSAGDILLQAEEMVLDNFKPFRATFGVSGHFIRISVTDDGVGMRPEILAKLFQPLFSTKPPGKGTGLGLSTSLGIVRDHGGFMDVRTQVGFGSTFSIYLPVEPQDQSGDATASTSMLGKGATVLMVDDEAGILEINKVYLEMNNYRVLTATNGAEAVKIFSANADLIQIVLSDLMMPIMDGRELGRRIKTMRPGAKLVFLTGHERSNSEEQPECDGILQKPYKPADLLKMLAELI